MTYHSVMTNLIGQDREDAKRVIDDDEAFDAWLDDYERKKAREMAQVGKPGGGKTPGRTSVGKEDFLKRMGTVRG